MDSLKVPDSLQSEVGAVQCARGEWHPALPATPCSWKSPNSVCMHCSWVDAAGMALQLLLPSTVPHSHVPLCALARAVLLPWACPLGWVLRNHQGAGNVHGYWKECSSCELWVWLGKDHTHKQAKVSPC